MSRLKFPEEEGESLIHALFVACPLLLSVGARATGHQSPSLRLTVQDYYLRRDYCRALPREGVRICRDSWNSVIQPAEATRSRQAGSGSSNGGLAPIWGGRSASLLSLQGCYIQTTWSSASDVEVQLGGREETTVLLKAFACR
jgi:hypothetical protein